MSLADNIQQAMTEGAPDPTDATLCTAIITLRHGADRAIRMTAFAALAGRQRMVQQPTLGRSPAARSMFLALDSGQTWRASQRFVVPTNGTVIPGFLYHSFVLRRA